MTVFKIKGLSDISWALSLKKWKYLVFILDGNADRSKRRIITELNFSKFTHQFTKPHGLIFSNAIFLKFSPELNSSIYLQITRNMTIFYS